MSLYVAEKIYSERQELRRVSAASGWSVEAIGTVTFSRFVATRRWSNPSFESRIRKGLCAINVTLFPNRTTSPNGWSAPCVRIQLHRRLASLYESSHKDVEKVGGRGVAVKRRDLGKGSYFGANIFPFNSKNLLLGQSVAAGTSGMDLPSGCEDPVGRVGSVLS